MLSLDQLALVKSHPRHSKLENIVHWQVGLQQNPSTSADLLRLGLPLAVFALSFSYAFWCVPVTLIHDSISIAYILLEISSKSWFYFWGEGHVLSQRTSDSYRNLEFIKETVEGLSSTIAGAVGENAVVNELQNLSDKYYLINDFSLNFNPPIFNKRENDKIYSIQIDHLLVCQSGIFVLETKNWSSKSIENLDLRSPVDQIKRTSYALFVFLNSDKNQSLVRNHWGRKKIPIKNIIVMTNKAPKSDFQHVKVLPLDKLNGYVQYFDEIFDESEVEHIFNFLHDEALKNK